MSGNRTHPSAKAVISALLVAACLASQSLLLGCAPLENLFRVFFEANVPHSSESGLLDETVDQPDNNEDVDGFHSETEDEETPITPPPEFNTYRCSSAISNGTQEYGDLRAFDRDYSTSWQEYVDGSGIGEWISCSASSPQCVSSVTIVPGNCDNDISYTKNGRPTRVGISLDNEYYSLVVVDRFREGSTLVLDQPVRCSTVKVTILEAVDGTEWSDTAIAEIIIE